MIEEAPQPKSLLELEHELEVQEATFAEVGRIILKSILEVHRAHEAEDGE